MGNNREGALRGWEGRRSRERDQPKRISRIIPPEHTLPCDFVVGATRFRKGVRLETVRQAAERWFKQAAAAAPQIDGDMVRELVEKVQRYESAD